MRRVRDAALLLTIVAGGAFVGLERAADPSLDYLLYFFLFVAFGCLAALCWVVWLVSVVAAWAKRR